MNPKRAFEGIQIIVVGGILLANSLGIVDWSVWLNILSLWPLLIVALGIELIGKALDNQLVRVLSNLVIIGGLLYGAFVMSPGQGFGWTPSGEEFSARADVAEDVESARARIKGGVGRLSITAGSGFLAVEGVSPWGEPRLDTDVDGDEADVRVDWPDVPFVWPGKSANMDVTLGREYVWDLVLQGGVSDLDADLGDLRVRSLEFDAGVSNAEVTLGEPLRPKRGSGLHPGVTDVKVDAGISNLRLRIPEGVSAEVVARDGIGDIDFLGDGDWDRVDDSPKRWRTEGFDEDSERILIEVDSGISNVKIETY